ncbi:uncharacterized protein LOC115364299 isoform X2 [Myripristis murdjan]|uniref:uncharacterized protein LOC115364299 isoform X2 n=1 Tax=Myripristis murdjan TaxID=586833 RepID=UPI001175CA02|nr:uncharacterized protein LOC115364299 isoform X2 [Myripristis murdjan]
MDVSGVVWVLVAAAVVVASILLAILCLDCGKRGPLVSIRQGHASEEYIPSPGFRIVPPYQSHSNTINPPSTLSPFLDSASQRHHSFTLTENESNPSYENPADGPNYENAESDGEEAGYIKVLPDPPVVEIRQSNQSLASTHSSVEPPYVNVDPNSSTDRDRDSEPDDRDYENVEPANPEAEEADSDDDDYEANYVNQPAMIDNQPTP